MNVHRLPPQPRVSFLPAVARQQSLSFLHVISLTLSLSRYSAGLSHGSTVVFVRSIVPTHE